MSAFSIKIIAVITMFIDHFGAAFSDAFDTQSLRIIGRMAFPLYVFLIAQGCHHTRSIKKYLLRLGIFAIISEIPFDLLFGNVVFGTRDQITWYYLGYQNVFFTLFFGVLAYYFFEKIKNCSNLAIIGYSMGLVLAIMAGKYLKTDYGMAGIIAIFLCACFRNRYQQMLVIFGFVLWEYWDASSMFHILLMSGCLLSLVWIYFYNGKEGPKAKWFFYGFYPVHLLFLFSLYYLSIYSA